MDYTNLSIEELRKLKQEWYEKAQEDGSIAKCYLVGRYLGDSLNETYGPKYQLINDDIKIYIDDYGSYMTVRVGDKKVCSTCFGDQLFVPGEWVSIINEAAIKAEAVKQDRENSWKEKQRQDLLREMCID